MSDHTPAKDLITLFDLENSYVLADKGMTAKSSSMRSEIKGELLLYQAVGMPNNPEYMTNASTKTGIW